MNYKVLLIITLSVYTINLRSHSQTDSFEIKHGSTILTLITNDTIWMAADRKLNDERFEKGVASKSSRDKVKIFKAEKIFFAIAGRPSISNKGRLYYDADKLLKSVIEREKNIDRALNVFTDSILKKLNILLDTLQTTKNRRALLQELTLRAMIDLVMVSFVGGKPNYRTRTFGFRYNASNKIEVLSWNTGTGNGETVFLAIGISDSVVNYLSKKPIYFQNRKNAKDKLVCLINMQAIKSPEFVGMPCDVVMVTEKDFNWYLDNKKCLVQK